jgi:hypothetical protein
MPAALVAVLALTLLERAWRGGAAPEPPQVETRLDVVGAPPLGHDAVVIDPSIDPLTEPAAEDGVSAGREALARVRDDTYFRDADLEAWLQTWSTIRRGGSQAMKLDRAPWVSFAELFGQPVSFRGRPVRVRGTLRRMEWLRAPRNPEGIEGYWQGWLEPQGGPASPIVVHFLNVPEGMPIGLSMAESVDVAGYFLKRHAYAATDAVRVAPLVMAEAPRVRRQRSVEPIGTSLAGWILASLVALAAAAAAVTLLGHRPGPRAAPRGDGSSAGELEAVLADFQPASPVAALREWSADQDRIARIASGGQPEENPPRTREP